MLKLYSSLFTSFEKIKAIKNKLVFLCSIENRKDYFFKQEDFNLLLYFINFDFKNDKHFMEKVINKNPDFIRYAGVEIKNNLDIMLTMINHGNLCYFIGNKLCSHKQSVLKLVSINGSVLQYISHELRGDKEVVLTAVGQNGLSLQYASSKLKNDREVLIAAIKQNITAIQYMSLTNSINNIDLIKIALARDTKSNVCKILHTSFINVPQNMMIVSEDQWLDLENSYTGNVYKLLHKKLKNNLDLIYIAVKSNGVALKYVSNKYKNNSEIIKLAIRNNGRAIQYAPDYIKNDIDYYYEAVESNYFCLQYANDSIKNNKDLFLKVTSQYGYALYYASDKLKNDQELVLNACRQNALSIEFASDSIKNEIGSNDPQYYLEKKLFFNSLDNSIMNKQTNSPNKKKKI